MRQRVLTSNVRTVFYTKSSEHSAFGSYRRNSKERVPSSRFTPPRSAACLWDSLDLAAIAAMGLSSAFGLSQGAATTQPWADIFTGAAPMLANLANMS